MKKVELEITGISYSRSQNSAYALILSEKGGIKKLPIIIGANEAQAIALHLEKIKPGRPLTHDLFKIVCIEFGIQLKEVIIHNLHEGIFYAKLIMEQNGEVKEIDSRTSDAVALAIRFEVPIYTYDIILDMAGIIVQESNEPEPIQEETKEKKTDEPLDYSKLSIEELNILLQKAIEAENFEEAAIIKKEIDNRKNK